MSDSRPLSRLLPESFLRTIGVSSASSDEREALWELAQLNSANATVCENLLIRWFGTADTYERGNARDGQAFRAAIGLNVEYHRLATRSEAELGGRLAAALGNPRETDPYRVSATAKATVADLGSALAALANNMEPQAATEVARGLAAALEQSRETESARDWLASTLSEVISCST